ncbi:hypothetical protein NNJEOMEG_01801 [Fundidesulfovibrio magnetotacticus]|uniref:Glycosyltransferase 2-like domain-containing protein n=1 Tax=Fundidesulfovibrio magnetotacticus TaxID=2730080 RepID=A0A6V8LMS9_9BACT|nr:TIGR04283 family arsenosugar biosynthesis glycosyltransferase [Fundidesulfovibrio magnetotacticus]GFK93963.1 hypothetical protein NNJEOMEG_01801 [Fundidesulfovibrio magnetotacticus]
MSPSYSVIVPVLGEAARINRLVDHVRAVGYGLPVEIVVVDGRPGADTLAALDRPGVTALCAPRGRARQMNAGAAVAGGDVLVFLHADCALPVGAFAAMERVLASGRRVGAFGLAIRSTRWSLKLVALAATLRSRITGVPYGDQAIFMERAVFHALGGYADIPILEDVDLLARARRAGMRAGFARGRCTASPRRWEADGVWRRTFANWGIMARYLLGASPERLARDYPPLTEEDTP